MYLQNIILELKKYWIEQGCSVLQSIDTEVGAATLHPFTTIKTFNNKKWNIVYIQPCRRPSDTINIKKKTNKLQHYFQFQVIMKPSPINFKKKCIDSLKKIGINSKENDIKFIKNNWKNTSLGAYGLGWELYCDGVEILQFTYMQKLGNNKCKNIPGEIAYGLERIAMKSQNINNIWEIKWNHQKIKYKNIYLCQEKEYIKENLYMKNTNTLNRIFNAYINYSIKLINKKLIYTAYNYCIKASHIFNLIESQKILSEIERTNYIKKLQSITKKCCSIINNI